MPTPGISSPQDPASTLNNLGFVSPVPAHGTGTLRTPFVELYLGGRKLPLIDVGAQFDQLFNLADPTPTKPKLLLIDFRYLLKTATSSANEVTITILDPQHDYLLNILSSQDSATEPFSFRFGWVGIDDQTGRRYPDFTVKDYSIAYSNSFEGARITLQGVDAGYELYTKEVSASFDPTTPISAVIESVIRQSSSNLEPDVEAITIPVGKHAIIPQISPLKYINHLLRIAQSGAKANSTYTVEFEPTLLGKTKMIIRSDGVDEKAIKKYVWGREKMGTLIDYQVDISGATYLASGAARAAAIAVDPLTKNTVQASSTQAEDASTDKKKVLRTPIDPTKVYTVPWSNSDELSGFLQGVRQDADKNSVHCRGVVHGDTDLRPVKQIVVQVLRSNPLGTVNPINDNSLLLTSGVWKLYSVEHIITAGTFRTLFTGYRNSLASGAELSIKTQSVDLSQNDTVLGKLLKAIKPGLREGF